MAGRIIVVGGGVRSGKSRFALHRALALGERRAFIATAQAFDDEMRQRIDAHRIERAQAFVTYEVPHALPEFLTTLSDCDVAVVDCLTLWLSNLLLAEDELDVLQRIDDLCRALAQCPHHTVLVSNEVGLGIVPESRLGRQFRDLAGIAHQRLAVLADELYLGAMGVLLRLKPEPLGMIPPAPPFA